MTGGDSGRGRRWDVALSFAGAQRDYAGQVAAVLEAWGVRCFYDADRQVQLWGTHLAEELPRIYARQSSVVVVFISADYAQGEWTRLERRAAFSRAVREAGVYVLPARFDDSELPGLQEDVVAIDLSDLTPGQFAELVAAKLSDLGISPPPSPDVAGRRPPGRVRVDEADPRRLGVHAAISVPGVPDETQPEYVLRDADAAEFGVRVRVAAAARRGGFVLLVGGSSVGKTRCTFEAVRVLLPDWWLAHPGNVAEVAALAAEPVPQTVVWLDELQRYLDGEHGLTGGVVRALLGAPHPAVIIATLWPDRYTTYTKLPVSGGPDPHAREREVLDLAAVIRISPEFSNAEQGRARAAATRDRRLQVALKAAGYGLTQTLAAAPQLVARWEDAKTASPYGWAVLAAAVDAARLGARAPLTAGFLRDAAPGYCTSRQQAEAPANWFEQALAYATSRLHGAAVALAPAGAGMGQVGGYTVADYLLQHASRERRAVRVPPSTWDALLTHICDPADAAHVADTARARLLYCYAIPLYRRIADADAHNWYAAGQLADLLADRGDLDQLRARADVGDGVAARRLADLLAGRGELDQAEQILRARADVGDEDAADDLADLLVSHGHLDQAEQILRARADVGDGVAARRLADLLAGRGELDQAEQILRARADVGDEDAADDLADLLASHGHLDQAEQILRARADVGDEVVAWRLIRLLTEYGDLDQAEQILRTRADAGDEDAVRELTVRLEERGDLDQVEQILRARADVGDEDAAQRLARMLADRGDLGHLCILADTGDTYAARWLAGLLIDSGDLGPAEQILRAHSDDGDIARLLAALLAKRGHLDQAEQILRIRVGNGDWEAAQRLVGLLVQRGHLDQAEQILGVFADADHRTAAGKLAELLADRGDLDQLRTRADAGDGSAAGKLAELLADRGDLDQLRTRADAGDGSAARQLASLLADRGDLRQAEELLRARVGIDWDGRRLAELLTQQDRREEADRLRRFGLTPDGSTASR